MRAPRSKTLGLLGAFAMCSSLAACASVSQNGTPAHRLQVWESATHYHSQYAIVVEAAARIATARAAGERPAVVEFDCITLGQDVNMDYVQLPTPDPSLSNDLNDAYVAYLTYASACVKHKGAPTTMSAINHYLIAGNQAMADAKARSKQVLG